jgi:two-component system, NtrC family, nitrogen regulation sensor histidine kinase NtrY
MVHLVALLLSYFIFRQDKVFFIVAEVVILISVSLSWQLFNELIRPLQLLVQGTEAIKDKDFNVKFLPTGKYEMDALINVYNQMMDELRTERTRQIEQHLFLEKLIHTSPTGIVILDYDENIQQVNPKALQLLALEEKDLLSKSVQEVIHPVIEQIKELPSGKSITVTFNGTATYKLQKSHFLDRGFPRHFIMIEELTAEILAAEKKAYGKVIRMMAHEVNNTIGPVNSILQSALSSQVWQHEKNGALLQNALQVAVDRNYNLNHFMRNFADVVRLPEPVKSEVDLHKLVRNVVRLLEMKAVEKGIQFHDQLTNVPFFIYADIQQMEQVLINIIKNAMEAIEEKGSIQLTTDPTQQVLIITDSGKGIAKEVADQLFSPFFSTKKNGQGIGLTLVKEVLMNHGFGFSLTNTVPGKTTFVIRF